MRAAARAVLDRGREVAEGGDDVARGDVGEPERADAGGVDDPAPVVGQGERHGRRRRVPSLADPGHHADGAVGVRHEHVDQRRLADPGVPDERRHPPLDDLAQRRRVAVGAGDDHGQVEVGVVRGELRRVGEVGLRQAQHRLEPTGVGGDERAVDEAGARDRVGQRGDDHQVRRVRDHDPLVGVGVVGGAPQDAGALGRPARCAPARPRRPRRRRRGPPGRRRRPACGPARAPASRPHGAWGRRRARRSSGPGRRRRPWPRRASAWSGRRLLRGRVPRPGRTRTSDSSRRDVSPRPPPRDPLGDIGRRPQAPAPTSSGQSAAKSGSVLVVAATSSTRTPATTSPTIAPAVAIRWSA